MSAARSGQSSSCTTYRDCSSDSSRLGLSFTFCLRLRLGFGISSRSCVAVGTLVAELTLSSFVEGAGPIASASRGWWRIRRTALRFAAFAASTGALAALRLSA